MARVRGQLRIDDWFRFARATDLNVSRSVRYAINFSHPSHPMYARSHTSCARATRQSCVCRHTSAVRMDASRRHADAARSTKSFNRNCPVPAEIAGNPPAVGSATPGVLRKNVSVTA